MIKDLGKLIIRILILGIPLYIMMLYAYLKPMSYMPIEYTMWQEEKDYISDKQENDVIIIGDSRAKSSLLPLQLTDGGEDIYNIAIGGCGPIEMYHALKEYLEAGGTAKKAIIIFAPYHFCDIDNWGQTQSFNYLSVPELLKVYADAAKLGETERLGEDFFTDVVSYKMRFPNKYLASIYAARLNGRNAENTEKYESVRAELGYTEFGSEAGNSNLNYETHHEIFDYSPLVRLYYSKLLQLAADNGISVIIEQAPVNEASGKVITQGFMDGYQQMLADEKEKHPDFTVVTEVPVFDNKYFGDNNHLNRSGAEKFTEMMKEKYFTNE